ncbi:conserved hypothetical protein [Anaeromyxobacter sp. Fw109-5]|nr:conserved hypothetical protein [Anaeromyxobacter sp. Fw109-5]
MSAMRPTGSALVLASALLAAGCRTSAPASMEPSEPSGPRDVPAVIVEPTDASRAALAAAVSAALHGMQVMLADDALTRSSTLVVERARLRDASGLPVAGRELTPPERFHLVKRGGACVLLHEPTGRAAVLESTRCAASAR